MLPASASVTASCRRRMIERLGRVCGAGGGRAVLFASLTLRERRERRQRRRGRAGGEAPKTRGSAGGDARTFFTLAFGRSHSTLAVADIVKRYLAGLA